MFYPFIGTLWKQERRANNDMQTFTSWEKREISTKEAARRIANNNCARMLNDEEFTKVANGLGYIRED